MWRSGTPGSARIDDLAHLLHRADLGDGGEAAADLVERAPRVDRQIEVAVLVEVVIDDRRDVGARPGHLERHLHRRAVEHRRQHRLQQVEHRLEA